jgi:hypothetical protein
MKKIHFTALLAAFAVWLANGFANAQEPAAFRLGAEQTRCPEYGTLILWHVIYVNGLKVAFIPPSEWERTVNPAEKKAVYYTKDYSSSITLRFEFQSSTNASSAKLTSTNIVSLLKERFPGVQIKDKIPCLAAQIQGDLFHFTSTAGNGMATFLPLENGHIEICLISRNNYEKAKVELFGILNSLRLERVAASPSKS